MNFISYEFIAAFILFVIIYYVVPRKFQWILLLIFNFLFISQAYNSGLIFLVVTLLSTYAVTRLCEVLSKKSHRFAAVLAGTVVNLGMISTIRITGILMPFGISFYVFISLGYCIDVYKKRVIPEKNFFKMALFLSFFPQLVQGPINKFKNISESLYKEHKFEWENVLAGIERILFGYMKKMVIGDRMLVAVNTIFNDPEYYSGGYVLIGMFFYALQLYADFTGGIDIAIGIGQVLGVKMQENFIRPYFSKSIAEYWRRWHISLGLWFKDYVFYPLSVNKIVLKFTKKAGRKWGREVGKRIPVIIISIIVWICTGLWHGFEAHFVVWGLCNCVVILVSKEFVPLYDKFHEKYPKASKNPAYKTFQILRTIFIMSSIRLFDCYANVPLTFYMYGTIFTNRNFVESFSNIGSLGLEYSDYALLFGYTVILLIISMYGRNHDIRKMLYKKSVVIQCAVIFFMIFSILVFGSYGRGYEASQFIYNKF